MHDLFPFRGCHLMQERVARDARVVDKDIDGAERRLDLGNAFLAGLEVADVETEMRHAGFVREFLRSGFVALKGRGDFVSRFLEALADGGADAAAFPR